MVAGRLAVLTQPREGGLRTAVMLGPLLPGLSDDRASIETLLRAAAERDVEKIRMDALNARPRVWLAVAALLRSHFPDLLEPVRRILFDRPRRQVYLAELRTRMAEAARSMGVGERVRGCF